jgi:hypothetical protein
VLEDTDSFLMSQGYVKLKLRVRFCHNLFPHALTRDIFFELIIIHIFSTIAVQVEWLTNFDLNSDMNNV